MTDPLAPRCLSDFLGTWQLQRQIRHGDGSTARFEGRAQWRATPAGADYVETGALILPGQGRFEAERRYLWGPDLRICFDDGRFFHQVPPLGGEAAHWCDPDQYYALYDFADWPAWSCRWRVRGPRKDYEMHSHYRPEAPEV